MAVSDDLSRVVAELMRLNRLMGWQSRVGWDGDLGKVAKVCGASAPQVQAWMDGSVEPTTGQALALLSALPYPQPSAPVAASNGHGGRAT